MRENDQTSERLLALLREYSDKLRILSERHYAVKRRSQIVIVVSMFVVSTAFYAFLTLPVRLSSDSSSFERYLPLLSLFLVLSAALFSIIAAIFDRSKYRIFDTHQVSFALERMLRSASQYKEHAEQSLADSFEFDIRLAEAEAALRTYHEIFRESEKLVSEKISEKGTRIIRDGYG